MVSLPLVHGNLMNYHATRRFVTGAHWLSPNPNLARALTLTRVLFNPVYKGPQTSKEGQLRTVTAPVPDRPQAFVRKTNRPRARPLIGFNGHYRSALMGRYSGNCELDGIRFITGPATLNYSSSILSGPAAVMALPLGNTSWCFSQRTHLLARLFLHYPLRAVWSCTNPLRGNL